MDAAAQVDRTHAAQLGRTSQPHASHQMRSNRINVSDDSDLYLEFLWPAVDTAQLAHSGWHRCGNGITHTDSTTICDIIVVKRRQAVEMRKAHRAG